MTRCSSVELILPWRGGDAHREQAKDWVAGRYAATWPRWPLTLASAPDGPWCKGKAVGQAVARSGADIVVVADADVWCDDLDTAVAEVALGAPWAVPHDRVHRLARERSEAILNGAAWVPGKGIDGLEQLPYTGLLGGGIVVLPREVALAIPIDPRFEGWGQEDEAWGLALFVMLGPPWRGTAPLLHHWHPPQERLSRRRGSGASWHLRRQYTERRKDPQAMLALLEEANANL